MKSISCFILPTALLFMLGGCQEQQKIFRIPEGHAGMFGYGSLMSKKFIENGLLDKDYQGPYLPAHLQHFRRSWTFAWPSSLPAMDADGQYYQDYILLEGDTVIPQNLLYLNIKEDQASTINGVLYIVPEADLPVYDGWELGYERFEVTQWVLGYAIEGGPVYAYKALPEFILEPNNDCRRNIIEHSYYQIIQDAFTYWGAAFEAEYQKSTEPVDTTIIQENKKLLWENPPLDKIEELKAVFRDRGQ